MHNACGGFTSDQTAVIQLGKEAKRFGIDKQSAFTLWEWAVEYGLDAYNKANHPPQYDSYLGGSQYHMKINGKHINIF